MQKLDDAIVSAHQPESMDSDYIPAIEGAKYYFALVDHNGKSILCLLDESDKWRPTNYQEMMSLLK